MKKKYFIFIILFIFLSEISFAQMKRDSLLVQFSGMVLDGTNEELIPVSYTNILVKGKRRGTYSDFNGFFSIVVEKGDNVEFSAIGYKTIDFIIPDTLQDNRYSIIQLMTKDTINLPETVIFPWPSKEHFKLEFLAMDVTSEMQERAIKNLAKESLERMQHSVKGDANEHADVYLRQQASNYYYIGQQPPMRIFSPTAWLEFFKAWKEGRYKRKK